MGNPGKMLPELNSEDKPELVQIPIIVEGEEDGQFISQIELFFSVVHHTMLFVLHLHFFMKYTHIVILPTFF